MAMLGRRFINLFSRGGSSASGSESGPSAGTMDFSLAAGDNTGLLALLEDI